MHHWGIIHHEMQVAKETLCLKNRAGGVKTTRMWQTPTFAVRFTCILATQDKSHLYQDPLQLEPKRKPVCTRGDSNANGPQDVTPKTNKLNVDAVISNISPLCCEAAA